MCWPGFTTLTSATILLLLLSISVDAAPACRVLNLAAATPVAGAGAGIATDRIPISVTNSLPFGIAGAVPTAATSSATNSNTSITNVQAVPHTDAAKLSRFIVVGTSDYASAHSQLITLKLDVAAKQLSVASTLNIISTSAVTPSWITNNPSNTSQLYATGETDSMLRSFVVDPVSGIIEQGVTTAQLAAGPVHAIADINQKFLFTSAYGAGSQIQSISLLPDGSIGQLIDSLAFNGTGTGDNKTPRPHGVYLTPHTNVGYVPLLGNNAIAIFAHSAGKFTLMSTFNCPPQIVGPRHMAINAEGTYAYLIGETSATISTLSIDPTTWELTAIEHQSLANGGGNKTNGAEVLISTDGKFLYTTTRATGFDSDFVASYSISSDGKLSKPIFVNSKGQSPRSASLNPENSLLVVGNEVGKTVTVFTVDSTSGQLTELATSAPLTQPPASFAWI